MTLRAVRANKRKQGTNEEIAYTLDTAPWGGYDSDEAVVILGPNGDDVSATHLSGAVAEAGGVITTPLVIDLGVGHKYKLQVQWKYGGNLLEAYCDIIGEV